MKQLCSACGISVAREHLFENVSIKDPSGDEMYFSRFLHRSCLIKICEENNFPNLIEEIITKTTPRIGNILTFIAPDNYMGSTDVEVTSRCQ